QVCRLCGLAPGPGRGHLWKTAGAGPVRPSLPGDAPLTPLRQRLIEDLRIRNYAPRTIEAYVAAVVKLTRHAGRAPDQLGPEDLRAFQLHLRQRGVPWNTFNQIVCGLRFFYGTTLGRPDVVPLIPYGRRARRLPSVLSPQEVRRLFDALPPGR